MGVGTRDWVSMLRAFYVAHDLPVGDPSMKNAHFHLALLTEEVGELASAVNKRKENKTVPDELADVLYVAVGMAVSMGIDIESVFRKTHHTNMRKKLAKLEELHGRHNSAQA